MKRALAVFTVLFLFSGSAFAVGAGYGMRGMAMGGTGIAIARDIVSSAYFNPAGLAYGSDLDVQVFAGGNPDLVTVAQNKEFLSDYFGVDMDIKNATTVAGSGVAFRNFGLSVFADGKGTLMHQGGSTVSGNVNAQVIAASPITLATTISLSASNEPSIAVGLNLKPIRIYGAGLAFPVYGLAEQSQLNGSGFGFDLGFQAKVNPNTCFGVVVRNIATSYTYTRKTELGLIDGGGNFTPGGPGSTKIGNETIAPEVGVGFGITMPETATLIAWDMENYSYPDNGDPNTSSYANDIHIGVEQRAFFNGLVLRAGYFNYGPTRDTFFTYGAALNIYPFDIGFAAANSQKDNNSSSALLQVGVEL